MSKTVNGIVIAVKRILSGILVPIVSAFPRAFVIEAKSAPAPAVAVIKPNPEGPWWKIPSEIKGKVSKTPLPTKDVNPLRTIENLIIELDKISLIPSKKSNMKDLFFPLKTKSLGLINKIKNITGIYVKIDIKTAWLAPKYCIKKPPIAGPISLVVLKLTAVRATREGTWYSSISLGARDILIGWAAEAITPINRHISNKDWIERRFVKIRTNNTVEHINIEL